MKKNRKELIINDIDKIIEDVVKEIYALRDSKLTKKYSPAITHWLIRTVNKSILKTLEKE